MVIASEYNNLCSRQTNMSVQDKSGIQVTVSEVVEDDTPAFDQTMKSVITVWSKLFDFRILFQ